MNHFSYTYVIMDVMMASELTTSLLTSLSEWGIIITPITCEVWLELRMVLEVLWRSMSMMPTETLLKVEVESFQSIFSQYCLLPFYYTRERNNGVLR